MEVCDVENIREYHIVDYLESLSTNYAEATIRGRYVYLKIFIRSMFESEIIDKDVSKNIKLPKKSKRHVYAFNRKEVETILNSFDLSDFLGYRNYTIMSVLFATGMRKAELLGLHIHDINFREGFMNVIGKGNKERSIPISIRCGRILSKYIKMRNAYYAEHPCFMATDKLFITNKGKPIGVKTIDELFFDIRDSKPEWSTRVSAHTFRHTFAKMFLLNGGDLFTLSKILGHEDISTTRIYLDLNITELKVQNDKYNPLDNQRWQYC